MIEWIYIIINIILDFIDSLHSLIANKIFSLSNLIYYILLDLFFIDFNKEFII